MTTKNKIGGIGFFGKSVIEPSISNNMQAKNIQQT
jgi:hypothetical protein